MNLPLIDINVEGEVDLLGLEFETLSQRSVAAAICVRRLINKKKSIEANRVTNRETSK